MVKYKQTRSLVEIEYGEKIIPEIQKLHQSQTQSYTKSIKYGITSTFTHACSGSEIQKSGTLPPVKKSFIKRDFIYITFKF